MITTSGGAAALAGTADAAPAAERGPLDEIVVTATRREASVDSIPEAVTVIPADAIGAGQLAVEALAGTVGGYVQQTTPGQGAAIIRGLKGSAVFHLVDGMRLNNAIFRSAPTQYFALVPGAAAERIEVVRGTLASLYGSDAVGGVVQLVTRRPSFDGDSTSLAGEVYAGFESADESRRIGGTLDAGNRRWFATVSGELLKTGDRTIGGGTTIGPSGFEARALRAAAGLTPDEATRWLVDVHYYEQPGTPRVDELVPGFGQDGGSTPTRATSATRASAGSTGSSRSRGSGSTTTASRANSMRRNAATSRIGATCGGSWRRPAGAANGTPGSPASSCTPTRCRAHARAKWSRPGS